MRKCSGSRDDVDDAIHVRRTPTAASGELHFGPPKSAAGRRDLPLPTFVAAAIQRHRLASGAATRVRIRPQLVVCNPVGESFQPASFSGMWKTGRRRTGSVDHVPRPPPRCRHPAPGRGCAGYGRPGRWATQTGFTLARYQDVASEPARRCGADESAAWLASVAFRGPVAPSKPPPVMRFGRARPPSDPRIRAAVFEP